jgi:NAD(P)H-dependent FMN reductase
MTRIGIILGSTRPHRNGEQDAKWLRDIASRRDDAEFELIDLRDYPYRTSTSRCPPPWARTRTTTPSSRRRRWPHSTSSSW